MKLQTELEQKLKDLNIELQKLKSLSLDEFYNSMNEPLKLKLINEQSITVINQDENDSNDSSDISIYQN
jgi:hypothetical protein